MKRLLEALAVTALSSVVVGNAWGDTNQYTVTDLGTLPGHTSGSEAYGINNLGQVVGEAFNSSGIWQAFLYSGGTLQPLGTLPGCSCSAVHGINGQGQIVGEAMDAYFCYYGFLSRRRNHATSAPPLALRFSASLPLSTTVDRLLAGGQTAAASKRATHFSIPTGLSWT